jgi:DNA-binding NtrC family response regulator
MKEREILFKFLFEMKNDLNDLKNLVFELIHQNDLQMPDAGRMRSLQSPAFSSQPLEEMAARFPQSHAKPATDLQDNVRPIIIERTGSEFHKAEVVDEDLNLAELEKNNIMKALKKHGGRRKEAAQDLGISERTLYRKIKEYELM